MIKQDLLGISVNDLIKNYCVLYDKEVGKDCGITTIEIAETIDKTYGNNYEQKYVFLDIFAADSETVKENKILSYYEVEKKLEDFIGWIPDSNLVDCMAICLHDQWVDFTKDATQLLLDLLKVISTHQELINDSDIVVVSDVKEKIDEWRKNWGSYWTLDNKTSNNIKNDAEKILKKIHEMEE